MAIERTTFFFLSKKGLNVYFIKEFQVGRTTWKCNNKTLSAFYCKIFKNYKLLEIYCSKIEMGWRGSKLGWGQKDFKRSDEFKRVAKPNWWEL